MREYARKYKDLIDGYWFDHCEYGICNQGAVHKAIKEEAPNAVIAMNANRNKSPLTVQTRWEDYTSGHPNPITRFSGGSYTPAY